jgi:hypothetical protein
VHALDSSARGVTAQTLVSPRAAALTLQLAASVATLIVGALLWSVRQRRSRYVLALSALEDDEEPILDHNFDNAAPAWVRAARTAADRQDGDGDEEHRDPDYGYSEDDDPDPNAAGDQGRPRTAETAGL